MKKSWRIILALVLILILVWFSLINSQIIRVNFGFMKLDIPLVALIFVLLLIGSLIMFLFNINYVRNQKNTNNELQKKINILENEVSNDQLVINNKEKDN